MPFSAFWHQQPSNGALVDSALHARIVAECDNKATIVIVNNTVCTPEILVNGDLFLEMNPLDSVEYAADAGTYDLRAKMALISLCVDSEETRW